MEVNVKKYDFFNKLANLKFVDNIILYGSRARGDCHDRSDIDLAISCPTASDKNWQSILDIIENADTLLKIDCVKLDDLANDSLLRQAIKRDGIILYTREQGNE